MAPRKSTKLLQFWIFMNPLPIVEAFDSLEAINAYMSLICQQREIV